MKLSNMLSQKTVAFPSIDYPDNINRKLYPIENINEIAKNASKGIRKNVSIILKAINNKERCSMIYHVPNKEASLTAVISPIFLFFFDGGIYLQSLIEDGNLRTYAVERIEEIKENKDSKALSPSFNPRMLLTDHRFR